MTKEELEKTNDYELLIIDATYGLNYNNNIKEICTYENVLEVIYILLTISNELLLKIIEKK